MRTGYLNHAVVLVVVLSAYVSRVLAQCDTARLTVEVKELEALTWSDYPKARTQAELLVRKYDQQAGWCQPRALVALGKVHWTNGDYALALSVLEQANRFALKSGDRESLARSYLVAGNCYYYQGYYDSAEVNFLRSSRNFVEMGHATGQIEVLHDLALMYHRQGDFARSLRYLLELEQLKEAQPNFIHYVGDFTGINNYFIDTLYYRRVISEEARLLDKFRKEKNPVGIYQSLINMGVAYRELGEHRRAAYYAARGSEVMSVNGYFPFWYLAAKEYSLAGRKDSCFFYHRLALRELPRATRIKVATTYEQIAHSYVHFGELDSALHYFNLSLDLSKAMNNRLTVASLHGSIAEVYEKLGASDRAEMFLVAGLQLARQVSVKHTSILYAFARDFYERRGQSSRALQFSRLHQKLVDSINRNENAMELMRFQAQLETSRKERELEATRLKLRNRTITLASFVVVTALSIGFTVVFYLQRRKIKVQNLMLSTLNQEQRSMMQEIHHRVKNNLQYIVSLLNLQAQTVRSGEMTAQIEEIRNRIMTMGVIHQRLYRAQGIQQVDVSVFVQELVSNLVSALPLRAPLTRNLAVDAMQVDVDTAIAIGLLINELITNAFKHAFAGHSSPEMTLSLKKMDGGMLLTLKDNGPGFRYPGSGSGFGLKLIDLLVRKLNGAVSQPDPNTLEILLRPAS